MNVSVCIPVYCSEAYIETCARSLFEQTLQEGIEFIFVNDGTPDQSFDRLNTVLNDYPQRKPHVKILHLATNQGVANARKVAMRAATGDYIIHCDPDDWVDPTMYETLLTRAIATNADMVYCDYIRYKSPEAQTPVALGDCTDRDTLIQRYLYRTDSATGLCNKLYRRAIVETIDLNLLPNTIFFGEDLILNLQLLPLCQRIEKVNQPLYIYRATPNSITDNWSKNLRVKQNIFHMQCVFDHILTSETYAAAMDSSRRYALYTAISSGATTATTWHRLWKRAKRGMWRDKRWNLLQKLIFFAACLNFTLTSALFKCANACIRRLRNP